MGNAWVCKTLIGGSMPLRASKFLICPFLPLCQVKALAFFLSVSKTFDTNPGGFHGPSAQMRPGFHSRRRIAILKSLGSILFLATFQACCPFSSTTSAAQKLGTASPPPLAASADAVSAIADLVDTIRDEDQLPYAKPSTVTLCVHNAVLPGATVSHDGGGV